MPYVKKGTMQGRRSGKGKGKGEACMVRRVEGNNKAHSMGPNIRMPRTWVSLPFMWFARMITWRMYACIGLLEIKKKVR